MFLNQNNISRTLKLEKFMSGDQARKRFENGYMCAESVLMTVCETLGYKNPAIPAMATAFCSGVSRTKGICGALQGGTLAISLIHGRNNPEQSHEKCYELVQMLYQKFIGKNSTDNCYELTGCDLSIQQGRDKFKVDELKQRLCIPLVEDVTDYTIKLLRENSVN